MNVAQRKGAGAEVEVADNILMNDGDGTSGESSQMNVPTISNAISTA
jgi:hypothetical protein